jgi:hypothetical protein
MIKHAPRHGMRRVQEIYPSFDTRRVLCKQQRNLRVKPMRAGRKAKNASNAGSVMSEANGQRRYGNSRSIAHCHALTKTPPEGQSTGAWSAMCRLGLGSRVRRGWPEEQKALLAHGENNTGLKQIQRHHLGGYHLKSEPSGCKKKLLCASKNRGLKQIRQFVGQNIQNTEMHWPLSHTTKTTNGTRSGQGATPETLGRNARKTFYGWKGANNWRANTAKNILKNAKNEFAGGELITPRNGRNISGTGVNDKRQILCGEPCETYARESARCLKESGLRVQQSDAVAMSLCGTSNPSLPMVCIGTITEPIGI